MTPTLVGRIQTRLFLVFVVGTAWTLLVGPVLPNPDLAPIDVVYGGAFRALAAVGVLGVLWELAYHALQQYRWEKDWPTLFGLVTAVNEGLLVWLVVSDIPASTFVVHFVTTWLVLFAFVHTGMRILFPRWRYRGGKLV